MIEIDSNGIASVRTDYRDTVYDALAAANRVGRANHRAIVHLQNILVLAIAAIVGAALIYMRTR